MFAGRGTFGWGGTWAGDAYQMLLYAHLQPEIVFDETITERGLDGYRVLVLPDCDVLTQSVVDRIRAFQARGGIVVGDDRLCPAIKPDIVLKAHARTGRADADKAALQALAAELRGRLDSRYTRVSDSSNPEIIPYLRRAGTTDYLFLVNDRREYGSYVGQHGLVMENGLPSEATVSLVRPEAFVYDLVTHEPVAAQREGEQLLFDMRLGPCDGRVYMIAPKSIAAVEVTAPEDVDRGTTASLVVRVVDADRQPLDCVVPVEVTIRDAEARLAEFSGYYGAAGGSLKIPLEIAANDAAGVWTVEVRELASGRRATADFRIRGSSPRMPSQTPDPSLANPVQPQG